MCGFGKANRRLHRRKKIIELIVIPAATFATLVYGFENKNNGAIMGFYPGGGSIVFYEHSNVYFPCVIAILGIIDALAHMKYMGVIVVGWVSIWLGEFSQLRFLVMGSLCSRDSNLRDC